MYGIGIKDRVLEDLVIIMLGMAGRQQDDGTAQANNWISHALSYGNNQFLRYFFPIINQINHFPGHQICTNFPKSFL